MKAIPLAACVGLAFTQLAYAQAPNTQAPNTQAPKTQALNTQTPNTQQQKEGVQQQIKSDLKQAGFTNIKITPESFFVRAKDKAGNPVMIAVDPTSFEEVTAFNDPNAPRESDASSQQQGGMFTTVPPHDELSSNLVGLTVYNQNKQDIGTIKDIGMGPDGVQAYILAVGGFLGMGDHYVAVRPSAVNITYNSSDKKWHAEMNTNADQLKAAPEFKYNGAWNASKT